MFRKVLSGRTPERGAVIFDAPGKTFRDEAYAEYATDPDFPVGREYLDEERPLLVARTFSKAYGLAALRIGYGLAPGLELERYDSRTGQGAVGGDDQDILDGRLGLPGPDLEGGRGGRRHLPLRDLARLDLVEFLTQQVLQHPAWEVRERQVKSHGYKTQGLGNRPQRFKI